MEAGRLLLRSLSDLPKGQRIGALTDHYRANLSFLMHESLALPPELRTRFDAVQDRLAAEIKAQPPDRRTDMARQFALRAWRSLVPPR